MTRASVSVAAVVALLAGWTAHTQQGRPQQPAPQPGGPQVNDNRATKDDVERWMKELSNWGRWGKDDRLGAVNTITPAKRQAAAALVKTGTIVSLAHDLITEKAIDAPLPFSLQISTSPRLTARDRIDIDFHGITYSHLDALCHVSHAGILYNGLSFKEEAKVPEGCGTMGIANLRNGIVTRGVLIDIPRLKGLPYLEQGTHVYREDIEAWEKKAGVKVSSGDVLLLRTGRWALREKIGPHSTLSGYDASFLPFLKDRDVALIGADSAQEVGSLPGFPLPIHTFAIVARGMNIFDNLDLEALGETAAQLKRWEFMFVASPLRVNKGTGSPLNPIAIF
jgi:kynurenine formamidase